MSEATWAWMFCVDAGGTKHLTEGLRYPVKCHPSPYQYNNCYRVRDNSGAVQSYLKSRFKPEKEAPKMGSIYLVLAIEKDSLESTNYDVIPDDLVNETFIEHTLDAAKKKLEELQKEVDDEAYVACIFELHSYYENRPFFVEVKR